MNIFELSEYELLKVMRPELPFDVAKNLAISALFAEKGVRYKRRSLFGLEPPEIEAPHSVWYNPATPGWIIEQGDVH